MEFIRLAREFQVSFVLYMIQALSRARAVDSRSPASAEAGERESTAGV